MIKRTYQELEPYFPPAHFGVTCKRYHGKDETGATKFWIGVSEFEPDGGADWASPQPNVVAPVETVAG